MNTRFLAPLFLLLLSGCSSRVTTDDKAIKKIINITEYAVLNEDFNQWDATREQGSVQKFDKNNNILEDMDYWGGILVGGAIFKYNNEGKRIKEYSINKDREVGGTYVLTYSGNKCEKTIYMSLGTKNGSECSYFDSVGNIIRTVNYYNDGKVLTDFHYKYNSAKQETEQRGTLDGKPTPTHFTYYDEKGNISELRSVDENGNEIYFEKFIYEGFDKNGNWKIRKSFMYNKPNKIAIQKVEYK